MIRVASYYNLCSSIFWAAVIAVVILVVCHYYLKADFTAATAVSLDTLMGASDPKTDVAYLSRVVRFLGWLVIPSLLAIMIAATEKDMEKREQEYERSLNQALSQMAAALKLSEEKTQEFLEKANKIFER